MVVEVLDIVAAAVKAVVIEDNGELLIVGDGLGVVGHPDHPGAGGLGGVDGVGEAIAVDDIVVGQAALNIELAVVLIELAGGVFQPGANLLAAHSDLIEPVFKAVEAEHIAQANIPLGDEVFLAARGQGRGNGELGGGVVVGVVGGVLAGAVIGAQNLHAVDQVHKGGGSGAQPGGGIVAVGLADDLEHIVLPGGFLIGLENLAELRVDVVAGHRLTTDLLGHGDILGIQGRRLCGLVIGHDDLADGLSLGIGLHDGDALAVGIGSAKDPGAVLVAGEHKVNGIGLLHQVLHRVHGQVAGLGGVGHAAVGHNGDHVGLGLHLRLIVLVGLVNARKVDALPVGRDVPLGDVGVGQADDGHLHAVEFPDLIGLVVFPGFPAVGIILPGLGIQVIGGHNGSGGLLAAGIGGQVVHLAVENVQTVVELMVARNPEVVAQGTEGLHGGVVRLGLVEGVVVGQRRTLNGVANVREIEIFAVFRAHLLDVGGDAGQAGGACPAGFIAGGVICGIDLAVQVRGDEERELRGRRSRGGGFCTCRRHKEAYNDRKRQKQG